ncbi:MAG: TldD/PmbA family protein [Candidatus Izemoplasmatales bacterium]|nr:TldD/PmbA family protein [Candidatus Izemoplasmatales bacterium]MDY0138323.1 TldD/PmbA family protein [Candidatus Izemoplasmatales bacterium]
MLLEQKLIEQILDSALETGADFSEVYIEDHSASVLQSVSGRLEKSNNTKSFGVGIRVAKKFQSVYGYTNSKNPEDLIKLAKDLSKSFHDETLTKRTPLMELEVGKRHLVKIKPSEVKIPDKVKLLKEAYKYASEYDEVIKQVICYLVDDEKDVLIANSEGRFVTETRVKVRLMISAVASDKGMMQTGSDGDGSGKGYEFLFDEMDIKSHAESAARIAKTMLYADDCPSGVMPVVINNAFGGVIFHEACGHSLEATSVAKNASVFCGKLGTKVASDIVTAIDDGTIENGWGSANYDDEGYPQQRRVLIENGILKSYMIDKINARRMGMEPTGSSRRQDYKFSPTSRMSNTFIDNGTSTFEEIIANTKFGLFAKKMGGGSVNPGNGDFNFSVMEGYMIRDGKIAEPVKGAALVGNGAEILHKIDMIANNLERQRGMCGSASGSIPADVGQPTVRVTEITVGGRKKGA